MSFASDLLRWFDENARALPWRGERSPYRIWLSEIMLQQTRTETVAAYYSRFLEHFPTVFALAEANEQEVLKLWEGLGYYSRARNLHATARIVAAEMEGRFPTSAAELLKLPGIGPYAANAIASIAYGEVVPALDGNQARVLSRVLARDEEIRTPFDLRQPAAALIDRNRPGDYNQALMDLGAKVCLPRSPRCALCPVAAHCEAFREDSVSEYPKKPIPKSKTEQDLTILLISMGGKLLVRRRTEGLLGGMYEFCPLEGHPEPATLVRRLTRMGFSSARLIRPLPDARHVFTHKIWRMKGWLATCTGAPDGFQSVDRSEMSRLPFPSALRVYREIAEREGDLF